MVGKVPQAGNRSILFYLAENILRISSAQEVTYINNAIFVAEPGGQGGQPPCERGMRQPLAHQANFSHII